MTERIQRLKAYTLAKRHHIFRRDLEGVAHPTPGTPLHERMAERFASLLANEYPVILPDERLVFTRTIRNACSLTDIMTDEEGSEVTAKHFIHERGFVFNICPDYSTLIAKGTTALKGELLSLGLANPSAEGYYASCIKELTAIEGLAERYRRLARDIGRSEIAACLGRIPKQGARTFYEALQFLRILHFCLWAEGSYHVILGRLDQYLLPYLRGDIESGRLTKDEAFELLEEFFLACNRDSDLYPGMQQGDNGQSIMLGGYDADGTDRYNELSEMCIQASLELHLIDPKINLRISSKTPMERYRFASRLTAAGLGFPQYSNDDVVVKALLDWGYAPEDAYNYVVAACWEFIIPGCGMDIPNIDALSFCKCVDTATRRCLASCSSYGEYLDAVCDEVKAEARALTERHRNLFMLPSPLNTMLHDPTLLREGRDISQGSRYNNYGIHGTGVGSAADYVTAVKHFVFDKRSMDAAQLIAMLDANFEGYAAERSEALTIEEKFGNDNDTADEAASRLLAAFAEGLKGIRNERGGIYRAGTASAMYYAAHAKELTAGADGRLAGAYLPANYSPSLGIKLRGPLSILKSISKPDLVSVCNGGPVTLELSHTCCSSEEGIDKIALLIDAFAKLGGHQMQLNVVNGDALRDAQKHPEAYKNLVVRVWGWSGYFVELDKLYQDQIIRRAELAV